LPWPEFWQSKSAKLMQNVVQIDEANLPGSPDEWEWAAHAINVMLDAVPNTPARASLFWQLWGTNGTKRELG